MDEAKIRLSPRERELVQEAEWILTKNGILEKGMRLFGRLQEGYMETLKGTKPIPEWITENAPKISRGEKYEGLPYLVLDYPRVFEKERVFAIRTFFWWGHYFSITLHLAGTCVRDMREKIMSQRERLVEQNFSICISEDPWLHHFRETNYQLIAEMSVEEFNRQILEKDFIKLARQTGLENWEKLEDMYPEYFRELLMLGLP